LDENKARVEDHEGDEKIHGWLGFHFLGRIDPLESIDSF